MENETLDSRANSTNRKRWVGDQRNAGKTNSKSHANKKANEGNAGVLWFTYPNMNGTKRESLSEGLGRN